ncbi:glycosyltransferase [Plantactinospora siamensis]|uniref:Glycosyltransferase n=1 Tax=Plantactinospora siamensis TaxID=555372 RepID=A0ABV6NTN6_9ACTN
MSRADGPPVGLVVDCSGVGAGGITRVLTELVRHWPAGWRLDLVAAPAAWSVPSRAGGAEVTVLSGQGNGRAGTIAAATTALRRATGRAGATTVLSLSPSAAVLGSRLPVVTVLHDLAFRLWPYELPASVRRYRQVSYGTAIRRSHRLVCVSARTRHDLLGLYGVPPARAHVWHPGSDLAVPAAGPPASSLPAVGLPAGPAAGGPPATGLPEPLARLAERGERYLLVAGHAPHKGVEIAVDALPRLPGHSLAVLTGGQPAERFRDAAARSTARDRIHFLDRLPDAGYAAALAHAAVFLMPSHFEGYGLPAAEALRLGTPTVVSPDPALHEATGGRAVRMTAWSAEALVAAVTAAERAARPVPGYGGRSWREATAELAAFLGELSTVDRRPAPARAGG